MTGRYDVRVLSVADMGTETWIVVPDPETDNPMILIYDKGQEPPVKEGDIIQLNHE